MTRRLFGLCQDFVHLVTSVSRSCASMRFVHFVYSVGLLYVQCTPCICAFIDCKCKGLLFLMLCRLQMQRPELLDDLLLLQMQELLKDNALCAANKKDKEWRKNDVEVERSATYKLLLAIHVLMAFVCHQLSKRLPLEIDFGWFLGVDKFFFSMIFRARKDFQLYVDIKISEECRTFPVICQS